jgi:hypothetical protein
VNQDVRNRIVLPIVIPVLILLSMAAFIGSMALLFLFNTKGGSLMLAAVAAAGILFTVSLASSEEKLDAPRRAAVVFAAFLPLLAGLAVGLGWIGGVADEDRMINVQPLVQMPDGAPTIAAENSQEFCLGEEGECEPVDLWEVEPGQVSDPVSFFFDNREVGVPHNVQITTLDGTVDDPQRGSEILANSTLVDGPTLDAFVHPDGLTWEELPDEWYFLCIVHPNMNGVGIVVSE